MTTVYFALVANVWPIIMIIIIIIKKCLTRNTHRGSVAVDDQRAKSKKQVSYAVCVCVRACACDCGFSNRKKAHVTDDAAWRL